MRPWHVHLRLRGADEAACLRYVDDLHGAYYLGRGVVRCRSRDVAAAVRAHADREGYAVEEVEAPSVVLRHREHVLCAMAIAQGWLR